MVKSFDEYQKLAMKTAVYPNIGSNLAYPVLGLIDEYGEFTVANPEDKMSELSDFAWYLAATATELNMNLDDMLEVFFVNDAMLTLSDLAGIAKKAMRDNGGVVQEEKSHLAWFSLARLLALFREICFDNGWDAMAVLQYNLDKLADRQTRGVIKGDGDYR